jgi:hypothetical protein
LISRCNKAFALKSYLYKHEESSCMKLFKGKSGRRLKAAEGLPDTEDKTEDEMFNEHPASPFYAAVAVKPEPYQS